MAEIPVDPLAGAAEAGPNLPEYTVSELSTALKRTVEDAYGWVRVRGEISGFKRAASGHLYFSLKDEAAVLSAVCWRGVAGRLGLRPEDGFEVVATGRLTTYPRRSSYQIVVESLALAGEGALLKLLEDRRRRLDAEGLFAAERKRELPYLPEVIGVVTSPTGAVIRDILHRLADRFPRHVLLWPVRVQGEGAAEEVAAAIEGLNALAPRGPVPRPDLVIVARGGGSLEDLWAFNEEIVVRAAAASDIPLISAVGHETDTTLIDFAADMRAPTPTAAAEFAVPVRAELMARVLEDTRRLVNAAARVVAERRTALAGLVRAVAEPGRILEVPAQRLDFAGERLGSHVGGLLERRAAALAQLGARLPHPRHVLHLAASRLGHLAARLRIEPLATEIGRREADIGGIWRRAARAAGRRAEDGRRRLAAAAKLLDSLSYQRVLERGFALVRDAAERPVTSAAAAPAGTAIAIRFHDGEVPALVSGGDGRPPGPARRKRRGGGDAEPQGTLL